MSNNLQHSKAKAKTFNLFKSKNKNLQLSKTKTNAFNFSKSKKKPSTSKSINKSVQPL
jgi:hypothetical protein